MQNPHEHEQSMQIGPSRYDSDTIKRQNIEGTIKQSFMNTTMQNRYPSIMVVMATCLLAITIVASVEIQRYLLFILVLSVEQMDTYLGSVHKCSL